MPQRKPAEKEDQSPRLLRTFPQVSTFIEGQIAKGKEIASRELATRSDYQQAGDDLTKWVTVTKDTLKILIYPTEIADTFAKNNGWGIAPDTLQEWIEIHKRDARRYISRLETVLETASMVATLSQDTGGEHIGTVRQPRKVFIVHGHDEAVRETVARFIERIDLEPIILHERVNAGRTIIEKFEREASDCAYAIVLMTPDDLVGGDGDLETQAFQARQNVVFELGYFVGALGRGKVCLFRKGTIEMPSDLAGVGYHRYEDGSWQVDLANEMEAADITINWSRFSRNLSRD